MSTITLKMAKKKDAPVLFDLLTRMSRDLGKEAEFAGSVEALEKYGFSEPPAFEAIIRGKERDAIYMRLAVHNGNDSGSGFYNALRFKAVEGETVMLLEIEAFDQLTLEVA
ncbi:hypothetical protein [Emcibacter sp.]|uniref:hypothetical protein n=1 Tax=Emcibacter sp. TaxID=1979954 RepID=UPI002AA91D8B|nr:hypothetical protein [Emcibacter sp.]